jgi:hypothetical protein
MERKPQSVVCCSVTFKCMGKLYYARLMMLGFYAEALVGLVRNGTE